MHSQRLLITLLSAALLVGLLPSSAALAEAPESKRTLEDSIEFSWGKDLVTPGTQKERDRAYRRWIEGRIHVAKEELRQLVIWRGVALAKYSEPDQACERQAIERYYQEERRRLGDKIRTLRRIRGDTRGFFTKAWNGIGSSGRRIVRAFGEEALQTLKSGGSLHGGVARHILIRLGRKELQRVVVAGLERKIRGRSAVVMGAAEEECREEDDDLVPIDPNVSGPIGELAIPPARFVGSLNDAELVYWLSFDSGTPEVNTFELVIDDEGRVDGGFSVYQEGMFVGCPGQISDWTGTIAPGQRVGRKLPQTLSITMKIEDFSSYDALADECTPPIPEHETSSHDLRIQSLSKGTMTGIVADLLPFTLELSDDVGGDGDEDAPGEGEES